MPGYSERIYSVILSEGERIQPIVMYNLSNVIFAK